MALERGSLDGGLAHSVWMRALAPSHPARAHGGSSRDNGWSESEDGKLTCRHAEPRLEVSAITHPNLS